MRDKTVTFLVKSVRTNRMAVPGDTTVSKLRKALEAGGYDVEDANIRIIRDGRSFIGHVKNVLLHDNDIVVFGTDEVQMRVSRDLAEKHNATVRTGCNPACCTDRTEEMKTNILKALEDFKKAVINA
jgi:hypothetical protein